MKQNHLKELMTALLMLCCTVASAQDFEVGGIYYNILSEEDKTVEVTSGSNKYTGAVTIPASVTYNSITYSVTSIGNYAFYYCDGLTSIEIPSSVTSIGYYAFFGCTGLTSIVVGDGNSVYDSRGNCNAIIETASNTLILGCKNTIIPEGVTSIGNDAFYDCDGLTSIEIPSSVTSIGNGAFSNCSGLTSIVVDEENSVYDSRGNCNAIIKTASNTLILGCKNTIIPSSVTSIGVSAFSSCSGLTSIEIPSSVTSISDGAFSSCTGLTSIEIPSSVTSIGNYAFEGCNGLTSIVSHIAAEDLFAIDVRVFSGIDKDACTLYVPAGAKSTYAATNGWKEFTNIVEAYDLTVTAAGYATLYLGTAVEIPAGVEAYTAARIEGDLLKMQAVEDVIPANTAVIIKAEEGNYTFISSNETPDAIEGNLLRGTLTDTYIKPASAQTAYVLSKVDGVVGMYRAKLKADGTFKNNANRVYMLLGDINVGEGDLDTSSPGGQLSNGYRFDFSGTTAIESVETES
ncbi:MAG: leucine-rich repeat domain-containing protein, partial [Bacteroidaceae bacterium]|nr:leucine-rich repeat domain-containing protein [Bacteroidaceae bacterium]